MKIIVQSEPFDVGIETTALHNNNPAIGAVASFVGYCRDEGGRLEAMELEHFPGMAESQLATIGEEASSRWDLEALTIIHRYGVLKPGAPIVLVLAGSAHRRASLNAVDFIMDYLKSKAPFWKKEHPASPSDEARWVDAKTADDEAIERWTEKP